MNDARWVYDQEILKACAQSRVAAVAVGAVGGDSHNDAACNELFCGFATHHRRRYTEQERLWRVDDDRYILGSRLTAFLRRVVFVVQHKQQHPASSHQVELNRFADMDVSELFGNNTDRERRRHLEWTSDSEHLLATIPLDDEAAILKVAETLAIGRGSMKRLTPKKYKKIYKTSTIIDIPPDDPTIFETPSIADPGLNGLVLSIQHRKGSKHHDNDDGHDDPDDNEIPHPEDRDEFDQELNWATEHNPDGVKLVHDAFDQGTCGSCWAWSAAGSLETSAARHAASDAFGDFLSTVDVQNATAVDQAVADAQVVERDAFQMLNLSVQELIDCDTAADQGCTGGNPLLAFYFIHRYGLTSWDTYPYTGHQDTCREELINHPVATVKSWGIISPNHENHMAMVLRYIGPIAVGINGASDSFLSYRGGIFDEPNCRQGANHALLITGYGEETNARGHLVRYWYARNSWGTSWGENGYVRIKRGDGFKGTLGVCGIARSPSVALGGYLLDPADLEALQRERAIFDGPLDSFCAKVGLVDSPRCLQWTAWMDTHKAWSLGGIGILFGILALWPLTLDCRRRQRRRELYALKRRSELERLERSQSGALREENNEATPLVSESVAPTATVSYGAST